MTFCKSVSASLPSPLRNSANSMPKQVEVRMHESHLEPIEARPQSKCAKIWSKMFKNLLLTLTVLGKSPFLFAFPRDRTTTRPRFLKKSAMPTTEHSVPLTQSIIMPLACYMRRRTICARSVYQTVRCLGVVTFSSSVPPVGIRSSPQHWTNSRW